MKGSDAVIDRGAAIGVIDSGVGGLTVVRELRALLPGEDMVFLGDSANCPYGNRSEDEIFRLSLRMIRGLEKKGAKCAVIACNTISAVADRLREETALTLFSIVECAAEYIKEEKLERAGLLATACTVESGVYERCLRAAGADCRLTAQGSPVLAAIIEHGGGESAECEAEIRRQMAAMSARGDISRVILGCTHYPIAAACFRRCCPGTEFIDPARAQARAAASWLAGKGLLRERGTGRLRIYETGEKENFARVCRALGIEGAEIERVGAFDT